MPRSPTNRTPSFQAGTLPFVDERRPLAAVVPRQLDGRQVARGAACSQRTISHGGAVSVLTGGPSASTVVGTPSLRAQNGRSMQWQPRSGMTPLPKSQNLRQLGPGQVVGVVRPLGAGPSHRSQCRRFGTGCSPGGPLAAAPVARDPDVALADRRRSRRPGSARRRGGSCPSAWICVPICVTSLCCFAASRTARVSCDRVGQRLLAVDVLAQADRHQRRDGVRVVGRGDDDGVEVLALVEHLAEVDVLPLRRVVRDAPCSRLRSSTSQTRRSFSDETPSRLARPRPPAPMMPTLSCSLGLLDFAGARSLQKPGTAESPPPAARPCRRN